MESCLSPEINPAGQQLELKLHLSPKDYSEERKRLEYFPSSELFLNLQMQMLKSLTLW